MRKQVEERLPEAGKRVKWRTANRYGFLLGGNENVLEEKRGMIYFKRVNFKVYKLYLS